MFGGERSKNLLGQFGNCATAAFGQVDPGPARHPALVCANCSLPAIQHSSSGVNIDIAEMAWMST